MEFANGRRDTRFSCEEEELEEDTKRPLPGPSSTSATATATGIQWGSPPGAGDCPSALQALEREHMFDKVVTPSDVGKLNRLVIPKQHAEKYFPLDATANEKGLLLSFEDRTGKPWRFRYSYWNSSQSYVMTKGWSRFVKEKRLDAGDTVSFGRGVGDSGRDRLFIDWKRRPEALLDPPRLPGFPLPHHHHHHNHPVFSFSRTPSAPWGGGLYVPAAASYDHHTHQSYGCNAPSPSGGGGGGQFLYFQSAVALPQVRVQPVGAKAGAPMVLDSVPVVQSQAAAKRVRLFGVNLDCPESDGSGDSGGCSIRLQPGSPLPLQLRLGLVGSSMSSPPEEQPSPLDLDL